MLSTARDCVVVGMFVMLAAVQLVSFRPSSAAGLQGTLHMLSASNMVQAHSKTLPVSTDAVAKRTHVVRAYAPIVKAGQTGR